MLPLQFQQDVIECGGFEVFVELLGCRQPGSRAVAEPLVTIGLGGLCALCGHRARLRQLVELGTHQAASCD